MKRAALFVLALGLALGIAIAAIAAAADGEPANQQPTLELDS